ncbi:hypothetical protein GMOD_00009395 [Pyrenophora seminiperda CCB06]|uniref:Uncharacterized protein n=1 Tax=Pyrenophora seminiperda CCB06 TaxID=1302712 RepID=A0A3M7MGP9_9PLEO|nr:hypothetical protein GMOD_00009395 [Pyrenophora seminiperda CCB06]
MPSRSRRHADCRDFSLRRTCRGCNEARWQLMMIMVDL